MSTWPDRAARRINKARTLLGPAIEGCEGTWADLGCGEGVFTYLLGTLLQPGSVIYAVDKNRRRLRTLKKNLSQVTIQSTIHTRPADFTQPLDLPPLDGLVMANSLHFVKQKKPVLVQLIDLLKPGGRLVVVEYNTSRGNYAVPHPLDGTRFQTLMKEIGLNQVQIVSKAPSSFLGEMYAGMAVKENAVPPNSGLAAS